MDKYVWWVGHKLGRGVNSIVIKNDSHPTFHIRIIGKILLYAHIPKYFFLLIDVFFDADSKSEIKIFRTALVLKL